MKKSLINLTQLDKRIFLISSDSRRELALLFLRYQEYYESPNINIRGKKFTLLEHQYYYKYDMDKKNDAFTYVDDWSGFNIPTSIIKEVHDLGISDINHYDHIMLGLYKMMELNSFGESSYLIGAKTNNESVINHELIHARYFIYPEYKEKVNEIISKLDYNTYSILRKYLSGYGDNVIVDEINAYIVNDDFTDLEYDEILTKLSSDLKSLYFDKFK